MMVSNRIQLSSKSKPVPGVPKPFARELLEHYLKAYDSSNPLLIRPPEGGWLDFMLQTKAKLYFDNRMRKFWEILDCSQPKASYIKHITGAASENTRIKWIRNPKMSSLEWMVEIICALAKPEHPYETLAPRERKRQLEKIIRNLKSAAQSLKLCSYFDITVIEKLKMNHVKNIFQMTLEDNDLSILRYYNPDLHSRLDNIDDNYRNNGDASIEDMMKASQEKISLMNEFIDSEKVDKLFSEIASDAISLAQKSARSQAHAEYIEAERKPELLSEYLKKIASEFEEYCSSEIESGTRASFGNARAIKFARGVYSYLDQIYGVRSPTCVTACVEVLLDENITVDDVKRWVR